MVYWIKERDAIRGKRALGVPKPWTQDEILQTYRFCNVRREDDKVTQWVSKHWRNPNKRHEHLWFGMVFARLFNLPSTLDAVGFPVPFRANLLRDNLHDLHKHGPIFNGAYIVSTNGKKMDKVDYLMDLALTPLWENREAVKPRKGDTLEAFHKRLTEYDGMGSFMAAQVVADVKYAAPLSFAKDWNTFASSGPGSRRGLNRLTGVQAYETQNEAAWRAKVEPWRKKINAQVKKFLNGELHGQDFQNCLCELDKFERVRLGEGRPKQKYPGV